MKYDLAFNPLEPRDAFGRWVSLDWRGNHRPFAGDSLDLEEGTAARADQIDNVMPDFYEHPEYYRTGDDVSDRESVAAIRAVHGKPDAPVKVYRALPRRFAHQGIVDGDWVTLSPHYAADHAYRQANETEPDWTVISKSVKARTLISPGDSLNEFGYSAPRSVDLATPAPKYHVVQPPPQDDPLTKTLAGLLAGKASAHAIAAGVHHLAPKLSLQAIEAALRLVGRGTVPLPRLGSSLHGTATSELYYRAAYVVRAAHRIDADLKHGEPIRTALSQENVFYRQHERAKAGRIKAARDVDYAAESFGDLLGWYLNPLLNNEVECIRANGHNFSAREGTVIGLPGAVHPNCGCVAGPPIEGAGMVNDAVAPILRAAPHPRRVRLKAIA